MTDNRGASPLVFFRDDNFYIIEDGVMPGISPEQAAKDHAEVNPGTIKVEDIRGKVLWARGLNS